MVIIRYHSPLIRAGRDLRSCVLLVLAQAGPKGPAHASSITSGWGLENKQVNSQAFSKGFSGAPGPPLYMVSFMDPPMLFIMVSESI